MKKAFSIVIPVLALCILAGVLLTILQNRNSAAVNGSAPSPTPAVEAAPAVTAPVPTAVPTATPEPTPEPTPAPVEITFYTDGFPEGILSEIPEEYKGTVEDYKYGQIYYPYGYDETQRYNVLFLLWGYAGNPRCWFCYDLYKTYTGKDILDAIYYYGYSEPMLLVTYETPGYAYSPGRNSDYFTNTVLPYVAEILPTYAEGTDPDSLMAARDHFGMAGFSNGSFYSVCSGLGTWKNNAYQGTSLDYVSWFGFFAGFRSPEQAQFIQPEDGKNPVHLALFCCGTMDQNGNYDRYRLCYPLWLETGFFEEGVNTASILYPGEGHTHYMALLSLLNTMQVIFTDFELTEGGAIIYPH